MIKSEYRVGKVWGIPIKIHISLLLLMLYMATRGALGGAREAGLIGGITSVIFVILLEVLIFSSIALHELGHSFVAIRKGCRVREITLMFIGGAAKMERIPTKPRDELLMAIAGPAVSLTLGIVGLSLGSSAIKSGGFSSFPGYLIYIAGMVNLILAGFNLLPAFPMDGGRVFRALLTPRYGRLKATYLASRVGRLAAVCLFIIGLFGLKGVPFFAPGNPFLVMISVFVFITADREYRMVQVEELMRKRGFNYAWPGMEEPEPPDDDSTVLISPPPYERGPSSRSELHHER
jgi:Zn-dependent protease